MEPGYISTPAQRCHGYNDEVVFTGTRAYV